MYNPYNMQIPAMQSTSQEVVKVNGKNGADAYQLPPNSSALLLDTTASIVWLVQTDGAGYKTATAYDIIPHKTEQEVVIDNFKLLDARISKLEEVFHAKSNTANAKQQQSEQHDVACD